MSIKATLGNGLIAVGGYAGAKTAVLATATIEYSAQFNEPYSLVGFVVPNWFGLVFYILFLVFGTIASINQPTPVDDKFKHTFLKPLYSFFFGVMVTLFVLPIFYPDITIWALIMPAGFFAAIGSVVIYYVIAFFTSNRLWLMISEWGYKSIGEYLKGLPDRLRAAAKAFFGGDK